jgi:hypothetical protein
MWLRLKSHVRCPSWLCLRIVLLPDKLHEALLERIPRKGKQSPCILVFPLIRGVRIDLLCNSSGVFKLGSSEPFWLQESRGAQGINISPDHCNRIITRSISKPPPGTPLPIIVSNLLHLLYLIYFSATSPSYLFSFTSSRKLVGLHRFDLRLAGVFRFTE